MDAHCTHPPSSRAHPQCLRSLGIRLLALAPPLVGAVRRAFPTSCAYPADTPSVLLQPSVQRNDSNGFLRRTDNRNEFQSTAAPQGQAEGPEEWQTRVLGGPGVDVSALVT